MKGKPIANSTYIVRNSGRDEELVELLEFRNIIVEQLYLMSQTIVTKTLYDGVHQSFVLKDDQDENVIGGICFYEIPQHKCVSIVYFAVASQYQMQGYGNYLMTKFKIAMAEKEYQTIATQADTISLNFYYKNGFIEFEKKNKKLERPPQEGEIEDKESQDLCKKYKKYEPWLQYIEDYYASLLVVYRIRPTCQDKQFSSIVKMQKQELIKRIESITYRQQNFPRQKTQKILKMHRELYQEQKQTIVTKDQIQKTRNQLQQQMVQLKNENNIISRLQQITLLDILRSHKYSWVLKMKFIKFSDDIFHNVLSNLITISTIQYRIANNLYASTNEMCADITKLFENLRLFLAPRSNYFQACEKLQQFINVYITEIYQGTFNIAKYTKEKEKGKEELNKS